MAFALAVATPGHAESKKPDKVGISVQDLGNPFFVQIVRGAETRSKITIPPPRSPRFLQTTMSRAKRAKSTILLTQAINS
jgi:hypothetical protein